MAASEGKTLMKNAILDGVAGLIRVIPEGEFSFPRGGFHKNFGIPSRIRGIHSRYFPPP